MNKMNHKMRGIMLAITGAIFWGGSGVCAEYIMQTKGISSSWLVSVRMLSAGTIILSYLFAKDGKKAFDLLRTRKNRLNILVFSLVGVVLLQFSFFKAIESSNAATATILQYLSPIFIVIFFIIESKKIPNKMSVFSIVLSLVGTALLVTKGDLTSLSISTEGLFWGLMAGVLGAVYIIQPRKIMAEFGTIAVTGWGMLIGGLIFQLYHPVFKDVPRLDMTSLLLISYIVVFGTVFSYICLLHSTRFIPAQFSSLLTSFEPLSSALFSSLFLGSVILPIEVVSMLIIIFAVFLLSRNGDME
ncbi:EamA family transporter [Vagococcus sp. DIV0080]|uniref:EamA family transporter n=1 Tax=Candidatus Vagococcus giribetii TaxID=2230876 RepID=A0ABS3HSK0_9ENTE|nr:EamA family transporter [Vagococcus sp. DIV0080]MBO0476738.1 EamA family transporter [Vagococcus sp. DIV0080]